MVGAGWYKVVYEKEGYAPAESEWLPVPPVQTKVNIPMIPLGAPEIAEAAAYDSDRVELRFDHFAQTGSTGECLSLRRADGAEIGFDLVCLDETFDAQGVSVGSRFRLWCWEDLAAGDRLILNAAGVTGANGVTLESGETALEVTAVVGRIDAQTPEIVAASDSAPITFTVFSPDGAPMSGVALSLTSPSACLALAYDMVVTDEAGTATVSVSGVKPGNGVVLAMEAGGTRATAAMRVVGAGDFPQEYVRACAASRAWLEDLRNTWTDGRNEDETIAGAYVDTFTAASDALRGLLPGDAAQDLAQLDAWDADMRGMIFGRINGRFSSEEFSRIASILDARNRMYLYSAGLK